MGLSTESRERLFPVLRGNDENSQSKPENFDESSIQELVNGKRQSSRFCQKHYMAFHNAWSAEGKRPLNSACIVCYGISTEDDLRPINFLNDIDPESSVAFMILETFASVREDWS